MGRGAQRWIVKSFRGLSKTPQPANASHMVQIRVNVGIEHNQTTTPDSIMSCCSSAGGCSGGRSGGGGGDDGRVGTQ